MVEQYRTKPTTFVKLPPIENLVFEGAGAKGSAYVGVINVLENNGTLKEVKRVAGSSAGGITAMLIALGYDAEQIENEMKTADFTKFMDGGNIFKKIFNLFFSPGHGIYEGKAFHKWAKEKVCIALGDENATFADLHKTKNNNSILKELFITGTNLSTNHIEIFSYETTPKMRIADAIRITMSFPFAFKAFPIKQDDGTIHYYADGGIKINDPSEIFDKEKYLAPGYYANRDFSNPCTLSFKVNNKDEREEILWHKPKAKHKKFGFFTWIKHLINSLFVDSSNSWGTYEKRSLTTIQIPDQEIDTLQFNLSKEEKESLKKGGEEATKAYFRNYRTNTVYGTTVYEDSEIKTSTEKNTNSHSYTQKKDESTKNNLTPRLRN